MLSLLWIRGDAINVHESRGAVAARRGLVGHCSWAVAAPRVNNRPRMGVPC